MKKALGIILAVSLLCIAAGIILLIVGGIPVNGWNVKYTDETFTSSQEVHRLDLDVAAGKANVVFYDGDNVVIEYQANPRYGFTASEKNGAVRLGHSRSGWFGWGSRKAPEATVKIPSSLVPELNIDISAGYIKVQSGAFANVDLDVSAGSIEMGAITCDKLDVHVSAGNAVIDKATCSALNASMSAGNFKAGVKCDVIDIDVSAGNSELNVDGVQSEYTIDVDKSAGKCNVSDCIGTAAGKRINVDVSAGEVKINFAA